MNRNAIYRICGLLFFIMSPAIIHCQELKVTDFYMDQSDLTANQQGTTVYDQNGEKCALIKIITTGIDFRFDVGSLGVRKVEQKVGEIWLYVPFGIKRIKINHQKYGFCEYSTKIGIEKARTYIMKLYTKAVNEGGSENFGQISINSDPDGAEIYLDGINVGFTPYYFEYVIPGKHKVSIRKVGYYDTEATVDVKLGQKSTLEESMIKSCDIIHKNDRIEITTKDVTFSMIKVKGGTFLMGGTSEQKKARVDEKPAHTVTLSDYYIGETEVTNSLWAAIMGSNPSTFNAPEEPVNNITWNDCQKFINRLTSLTGLQFALPTEAQWEFAARGGAASKNYLFAGSNSAGDVSWYSNNSKKIVQKVKGKKSNELGIYDMSGNVYEWCSDWYSPYNNIAQINPEGAPTGATKVYRGGNAACEDKLVRVSSRFSDDPNSKFSGLGMRLCLSEE